MYGAQFATSTNAARPAPSISSCSSKRAWRSRAADARDLHERDVARAAPVGAAAQRIDAPHELGVEAEARVEPEASPVDATEPDPAGAPFRNALRSLDRVAREPERAREHARPASREKAERHVDADAVQHLVVRAVASEHVDRVHAARGAGDLGRLPGCGRETGLGAGGKRGLHRREPVLVDARGERVDDEEAAHLGVA